jgi:hypothetical protein
MTSCPPEVGFRARNQSNNQSSKHKGSVCRYSGWPTAGFCLTRGLTHVSELLRKREIVQKRVHIHRMWMGRGAKLTGRHARRSRSWSRGSKRPNGSRYARCSKVKKIDVRQTRKTSWILMRCGAKLTGRRPVVLVMVPRAEKVIRI